MVEKYKTILASQRVKPTAATPFYTDVHGHVTKMYGFADGVEPSTVHLEPVPSEDEKKIEDVLTKLGFKGHYNFKERDGILEIWNLVPDPLHTGYGVDYIALVDIEKKKVKKIWTS